MLYHVMERHNFLPEAFTHDFRVHWGNHPLRPEFIESTYFLYKVHRHVCVGCVGVCVWGDGGGCVCVGWVGVHGIQVMAAEKNIIKLRGRRELQLISTASTVDRISKIL